MHATMHPPPDWMKIAVVDPGTSRAGLLCLSVPGPPANHTGVYQPTEVHAYAERMLYNEDAKGVATALKELTGNFLFETFIIDKRAGRQTPMGFSWTIREQYRRELKAVNVFSKRYPDSDFEYSSDDVDGRELLLKAWLRDGTLKVHSHMANLTKQMTDFYRSRADHTKREKSTHKPLEMIHALEYAAAWFNGKLFWTAPTRVEEAKQVDFGIQGVKDWTSAGWNLGKYQRAKEKRKRQIN